MNQQITTNDLFEVIGRQTVEIESLRRYIIQLENLVKSGKEKEEKKNEGNGILASLVKNDQAL